MRGLILTIFILALLPAALLHPYIGVWLWTWVGLMNPHRLTFGFAHDFPFAYLIGIATLLGLLLTKDPRRLPVNGVTITLFLLFVWMCVTSLFAIHPDQVAGMWIKVAKIQIMIFVALTVFSERRHVETLIWIMVISLGFYGVKGGIFTLLKGGAERVLGPGGFIEGNNELALALVMTIPLMRYLQLQSRNIWTRNAFWGVMALTAIAALGTHSRGGMLATVAMGGFLWIKSPKKLGLGLVMGVTVLFVLSFMPERWTTRMESIGNYEQDTSAQGRDKCVVDGDQFGERPSPGGWRLRGGHSGLVCSVCSQQERQSPGGA
jgi:putative inorganic carbon (hco3(-)) transporter